MGNPKPKIATIELSFYPNPMHPEMDKFVQVTGKGLTELMNWEILSALVHASATIIADMGEGSPDFTLEKAFEAFTGELREQLLEGK